MEQTTCPECGELEYLEYRLEGEWVCYSCWRKEEKIAQEEKEYRNQLKRAK